MKNYVQRGDVLTLPAPAGGVLSGAGLLVGVLFGVAASDAAVGDDVEASVVGVFDIAKAAVAVTQGAALYWDDAAKKLTTVAAGNTLVAVAVLAAAVGDASVRARLNGPSGGV